MSRTALHSTAEVRRANRNRVYRYLYGAEETVTKQDLAYALSMSLPTLTQNLNELLEEGLIDNSETADSSGGRKPRILTVIPDARYAVGVELSSNPAGGAGSPGPGGGVPRCSAPLPGRQRIR